MKNCDPKVQAEILPTLLVNKNKATESKLEHQVRQNTFHSLLQSSEQSNISQYLSHKCRVVSNPTQGHLFWFPSICRPTIWIIFSKKTTQVSWAVVVHALYLALGDRDR